MSLVDYVRAVPESEKAGKVLWKCSQELTTRQILKEGTQYGRWDTSFSTSGNGWIIEVLMEIYNLCLENQPEGVECEQFRTPVARALPWIFDRTYGKGKYSIELPNPEKARGGIFWSRKARHVRTDSVCHGMNAYIDFTRSYQ